MGSFEEIMCSVVQKLQVPGFFKKPQQGRKMLAENTEWEEMSSGKRRVMPSDPELERVGAALLPFGEVIKTCQNSRRRLFEKSEEKVSGKVH